MALQYMRNDNSNPSGKKIAIYARKSKITETGKSIENQISKCMKYCEQIFDATEDDIIIFKDEGLSGFYSDRPDYMKMLDAVRNREIRAVVCYKFDRISRKTIDLLNLVDYLNREKIPFVSCSDNIDTSTNTGKIMMSLLASIAEFERGIIAERIADNMYELAKEGRWLGGTTPTGFCSKKEFVYHGNKKTSINHLEALEDELAVVQKIAEIFLQKRSMQRVVDYLHANHIKTKNGADHTRVSVKNILSNPVYAIADADMYNYFKAFDVPIYAQPEDFDGLHGLMIYNKTDQMKVLKDDSTAFHPHYVQKQTQKDIQEWIVSVGKHKGILPGKDWIKIQSIMKDNREKHQRPNEKTESLLSGLIACPLCGKNLFTHRESGRYSEGKPRFVYQCQVRRNNKSACSYKPIRGNDIDKFVLQSICSMSEEGNEYYNKLLEIEDDGQKATNSIELEMQQLQKSIAKLERDLSNQTQILRDADSQIRAFILEDMKKLAQQKADLEEQCEALSQAQQNTLSNQEVIAKAKELIFSFPKLVENLSYQERLELVRLIIEKVYVVRKEDGDDEVHMFLKGTPEEDYHEFFKTANGGLDLLTQGQDGK